MRKIIDLILETMNRYPIAFFFLFLSLLTYIYTKRISKLINTDEKISVTEMDYGWCLTALNCHTDEDLRGSYTECDEVVVSDTFENEKEATEEKKRIIKETRDELINKDFFNFRFLGDFFINFPYMILFIIGFYDYYRKEKEYRKG